MSAEMSDWPYKLKEVFRADIARAALAQPEPAPTDEEMDELKEMLWDQYKTLGYQGEEFMYEHPFGFALDDFARAVLARWGTPANNTREENLND